MIMVNSLQSQNNELTGFLEQFSKIPPEIKGKVFSYLNHTDLNKLLNELKKMPSCPLKNEFGLGLHLKTNVLLKKIGKIVDFIEQNDLLVQDENFRFVGISSQVLKEFKKINQSDLESLLKRIWDIADERLKDPLTKITAFIDIALAFAEINPDQEKKLFNDIASIKIDDPRNQFICIRAIADARSKFDPDETLQLLTKATEISNKTYHEINNRRVFDILNRLEEYYDLAAGYLEISPDKTTMLLSEAEQLIQAYPLSFFTDYSDNFSAINLKAVSLIAKKDTNAAEKYVKSSRFPCPHYQSLAYFYIDIERAKTDEDLAHYLMIKHKNTINSGEDNFNYANQLLKCAAVLKIFDIKKAQEIICEAIRSAFEIGGKDGSYTYRYAPHDPVERVNGLISFMNKLADIDLMAAIDVAQKTKQVVLNIDSPVVRFLSLRQLACVVIKFDKHTTKNILNELNKFGRRDLLDFYRISKLLNILIKLEKLVALKNEVEQGQPPTTSS